MTLSWSNNIVRYGAIAGALAAIGGVASWTWGAVGPAVVNGPLPAASETEVAQALQAVQKGQNVINKRLEGDERHNRDQDLKFNALRRKAVLIDMMQLQAELKRNPGSVPLRSALDQDQQDLNDLADEHRTLLKGK